MCPDPAKAPTRIWHRSCPRASSAPLWLTVLACIGIVYLVLPLILMSGRIPWSNILATLSHRSSVDALWLSLRTCLVALLVDLTLGIPLAVVLSRPWPGVRVARVLVALPLSLPPVVAGLALLTVFGRRGVIGPWLESVGWQVAFSTTAVVLAQVFVSLPFLVVTLEAALRVRPRELEKTAAGLGASPTRVLMTITLPLVVPGLVRGASLALARCLGEFGATLTFAGSLQGTTRTLPLQIYLARESDPGEALVLGMLLVVVAAIIVATTEWRRIPDTVDTVFDDSDDDTPGESQHQVTSSPPAASVLVDGGILKRDWQVKLDIPPGQVVAIMGHNGAGKSTLADVLAGRLALDSGSVMIADRKLDGPGVFVPARDRRVAALGQQPNVFGHMSVLANVAYPLRSRGIPRSAAETRAMEQLQLFGASHLAGRRGTQLSGGQAARIALARALVFEPDLLVLDEPTAALDVQATDRVSRVLRHRLCTLSTTTILITHDPMEALELADQLVIMDAGRVVESGPPSQLLRSPTSRFTARLAGLNIVSGPVVPRADGLLSIGIGQQELVSAWFPTEGESRPERATMVFPPEAVSLHPHLVTGSPRTMLSAKVLSATQASGLVTVRVELSDGSPLNVRVTTAAWAELTGQISGSLWCSIKATQVRVIDAAGT
ncbi:NifC-like ABC-type porter [Propionibacterium sp. oral taxon 192 str. F0372]|uniref:ABC transporter permease n=1 Tax=Propionibacterium sp. oral taxon 192 TaxID=671222 RepID=UPI0003542B50|nr:NifC-like ABC-type porter [Propionibacterium sp. oral taxon 192 str. F0372]